MEIDKRDYEREIGRVLHKLSKIFRNDAGFQNGIKYLRGLLGSAARKNGWQLSEYLGESTPYALQQFLYRGRFSADEARDVLREYATENLGEEAGVLVVDETGFLKQGKKSCGVQRQYSGTAGRIENCQIGVFLTYAGSKGHSPIDRRLYMPEGWIGDAGRCKAAGAPEGLVFQTKPQMALEMIREATEAGVPYTWVTGDSVYGGCTDIRMFLEGAKKSYVMGLSGKAYVWRGFKQEPVSGILRNLPEEGWFEASCGNGSKGERLYCWQTVEINPGPDPCFKRTMLVRRSISDPEKLRAYICFAVLGTPKEKLVEIAGSRWTVESCFKESKTEVGLDQYEVRSYEGWYKHITFACIALALLTVLSGQSLDTESMQRHGPGSSSLEEFKKKRNLHV